MQKLSYSESSSLYTQATEAKHLLCSHLAANGNINVKSCLLPCVFINCPKLKKTGPEKITHFRVRFCDEVCHWHGEKHRFALPEMNQLKDVTGFVGIDEQMNHLDVCRRNWDRFYLKLTMNPIIFSRSIGVQKLFGIVQPFTSVISCCKWLL